MEVKLISEESFTVTANGKSIHGMRVVSEWEGLKKLTDSKGRALIVASTIGPAAQLFNSFLFQEQKNKSVIVVMGTPELIAELEPDKPADTDPRSVATPIDTNNP